ncbi:2-phosphosulfolactate phosphatase [Symbioplanes lichenis]|uniref:2-phosphosulfolactate phosphatase n=1 Tax=Symbioplanes lichenis TaxID=1629072 RepID=UPI002738518B|nr:2-phosphosulfolactate phosphatase [Actinoplanes lichenis]
MTVTFDWGPQGARSLAPHATVVAVVDVLSFTTTLTVALDRGISVAPYPWRDESAVRFAARHDAVLAVGRREHGPVSLSPATVRAARGIERLVLPSPNGATISALLGEYDATVVGVSLRNAASAAAYVTTLGGTVAVVASGERWPDGSLRPAVEDLWGAGAFLHHLAPSSASPEARSAIGAYRAVSDVLSESLHACFSGLELIDYGFPQDVAVAAEAGQSDVVPVLRDGWYVADPGPAPAA